MPASSPLIIPIIMAGGAGTRLWPVSRDSMPKQFIPLLDSGMSTFQATLERLSGPGFDRPIVITNNDFRFIVAEQMALLRIDGEIVLEPERRDSAAAVAVGTVLAEMRSPDSVCVVVAADHAIGDTAAFAEDCRIAAAIAASGPIMTIGIVPDHPSTAYGYIEQAAEALGERAHRLARFVEKPEAAVAERYVAEGYLWNSGNFIFSVPTMLAEMERFCPDVLEAARAAVEHAARDLDFLRLDAKAFAASPKISIDYAVMEKTDRAGVLAASFDWSDIGSWDAIHALKEKDGDGNRLEGQVSVLATTNSFVRSEDMLATVVGLDDVIVVATHDAVLVAAKKEAGRVKDLVAQLRQQGRREAGEHLRIYRPWGWYQRIDLGDRFQVKHICVKPGGLLSLQRHHHRAEHWVVVHGTAEVTIDDTVKHYHENEAAYLPIGCIHRLHNPGKIDLKLIEVQVGSYTGEDDIVRIEDVYLRN
ncbi:mannose-1-phosphate guanylyltransferase/mannose-6-phosphate isomerase [Aurantimonas sp. HBX-1]|uniref:mannose-1-phosphate guanylyltransferase/mannose-6-phosphate isomerase n=1 Tax=Aurantimonas sp. HBX-1 TaxID=2906072 RepID=UPI001F3D6E9F|nr:mannose-1-phosphate guanylyltransferase/mannose-6-phosphate isomerase [Aurantimonas sp. HBX-1]UIJ70237.1 mannose-1-phosphate guanylyltransferase/mannose-6-phosphate isomerase [Aurantimonas sp. HBX-1]